MYWVPSLHPLIEEKMTKTESMITLTKARINPTQKISNAGFFNGIYLYKIFVCMYIYIDKNAKNLRHLQFAVIIIKNPILIAIFCS